MKKSSEQKKSKPHVVAGRIDPNDRELITAAELSRRIRVSIDTIFYYCKSGIYSRDKTRVVLLASFLAPRTVMTTVKAYEDFLEEINRVHPNVPKSSEDALNEAFGGRYSAKFGDCVLLRLPENIARHLVKQLHPEDWIRNEIDETLCHFS